VFVSFHVQVRGFAPEVLVMMGSGAGPTSALRATSELAALPGWWGLPAVKAGRVYVVDRSLFLRAGPRIVRTSPLRFRVRMLSCTLTQWGLPLNSVGSPSLQKFRDGCIFYRLKYSLSQWHLR